MSARALLAAGAALLLAPPTADAATAPFAARLAQSTAIGAPGPWGHGTAADAWALLPAHAADRQPLRWRIVTARLRDRMGYEAAGVLAVMRADEPDLELVPVFRLAEGAALSLIGRADESVDALNVSALAADPEACLWRMRSLAMLGRAEEASVAANCARPAIAARPRAERAGLHLFAASAALSASRFDQAAGWLAGVPDGNGTANILRGRLALAQRRVAPARLAFERATLSGPRAIRAEAQLRLAMLRAGVGAPAAMIDPLRKALWRARGGGAEREGLDAAIAVARAAGDDDAFGEFVAARLRYLGPDNRSAGYRDALVARLDAGLAPGSVVPLARAAERMWRYRDLVPGGVQGDTLLFSLVARLEAERLWNRAADLLAYRMAAMPRDIERGPIALRVVRNRLLAGTPDRALGEIRGLAGIALPQPLADERDRLEAIALYRLGQRGRAEALLESVPDGAALAREMAWRARDWAAVADGAGDGPGALSRRAIALAMLGRTSELERLAAANRTLGGAQGALLAALARPSPDTAGEAAKAIARLDAGPGTADMALLDAGT